MRARDGVGLYFVSATLMRLTSTTSMPQAAAATASNDGTISRKDDSRQSLGLNGFGQTCCCEKEEELECHGRALNGLMVPQSSRPHQREARLSVEAGSPATEIQHQFAKLSPLHDETPFAAVDALRRIAMGRCKRYKG